MGLNGLSLANDLIPDNLLFSLGVFELDRCKLGSSGAIEQILFRGQTLATFDICEAHIVKTPVSGIVKESIFLNARRFSGAIQGLDGLSNAVPLLYSLLDAAQFLSDFLLPSLDREVSLSEADLGLARIRVHCDQVTGIAREEPIRSVSLGSTSDRNHFRRLTELVIRFYSRTFTR